MVPAMRSGGGVEAGPRARRRPALAPVLLDTNAVLLPFREAFPLERELARVAPGRALLVPDSVRTELERLVDRAAPGSSAALAWALRHRRVAAPGIGDAAVERVARRLGAWVVTGDRALVRRLRAGGVTVLRPSGHGRLRMEPGDLPDEVPKVAGRSARAVGNR